jgi:hypothetical protein
VVGHAGVQDDDAQAGREAEHDRARVRDPRVDGVSALRAQDPGRHHEESPHGERLTTYRAFTPQSLFVVVSTTKLLKTK